MANRKPNVYWKIWWWLGYHGLYQINWWWKRFKENRIVETETKLCPNCGLGIDDNGDGDCAYCAFPGRING